MKKSETVPLETLRKKATFEVVLAGIMVIATFSLSSAIFLAPMVTEVATGISLGIFSIALYNYKTINYRGRK